jgi:hypothetical protein
MVMLAGAFVAGDIVDPFEAGSGTTSLSRTPTPSPSPTPTTEPTEEPTPDPHATDSYYTTDGSDPALFPECSGALGLCLGGPVDRATASFGIEDERFGGQEPGSILRAWNMDDIRLTVEADDVGSITSLSVSIPGDRETSVRVALPEGLVLGDLTLGDVVDRFGPASERDDFVAENIYFYIFGYPYGPEGVHVLSFSHSSDGAAVEAGQLGSRKVTAFSAEYAS